MTPPAAEPPDRSSRRLNRISDSLERSLRDSLTPEFEVVGHLGGGRSSTVYLAREPALRRLVAIKLLHPDAAAVAKNVARFRREAMALAAISHPNVVSIYRVGEVVDGAPYLVMQYVRGRNLRERLKDDGPFEEPAGRDLLRSIAAALATVHSHGLAHRDVRPQSILCERDSERVLLADFGLAARLAGVEEEGGRLTTTGHIITDFRFSSPEVLRGDEATGASDVYSLGILGYHVLSGLGPYPGSGMQGQVRAHLTLEPLPLSSLGVRVSPELQELLDSCLAKDPARRPEPEDVVRSLSEAHTASGTRTEEAATGPRGAAVESRTDARLSLKLLGSLGLTSEGGSVDSVLKQPKRLALLAYLAVKSGSIFRRRDSLIGLFWPGLEHESGRHSLRQALYVLRRELGGEVIVSRGDEEVGLDRNALSCDAAAFEERLEGGFRREAMDLYDGDLMPGFYLDGAPEFERWLEVERLRLRRLAAAAARDLSEAAGDPDSGPEAVRWARRAVDLDLFDEPALHRLVSLLHARGDRAGAISAYEHFAQRLSDEYATEPSERTRALIDIVRQDNR